MPLDDLVDVIDEAYLIERKRGQVVTPPTRHRDAILTDDSQIPRHLQFEQTGGRVARQSPSRHCRKPARQLSRGSGEEKLP